MVLKLQSKENGRKYDCFAQSVDVNRNGKYKLRYAIGHLQSDGLLGANSCFCIYDNEEFNRRFTVIG